MIKALFIALLMSLLMTVVSAFIRLSDSGVACETPGCYTSNIWVDSEPGITIGPDDSHTGLRVLHRLTASIFALLTLLMMIVSIWYRKVRTVGVLESILVFGLTCLLAVVGMNTPNIIKPMITFINISGGMLLSAILYFWMRKLIQPQLRFWRGQTLLTIASCLVFLAVMSGAWTSSNYAANACDSVLNCTGLAETSLFTAFSPFRELTVAAGQLILDGSEAMIGFGHHFLVLVMVLLITTISFDKTRQKEAPIRIAMLSTMMMLLVVQGLSGLIVESLMIATFHNVLSVLLLLTILSLFKVESSHD